MQSGRKYTCLLAILHTAIFAFIAGGKSKETKLFRQSKEVAKLKRQGVFIVSAQRCKVVYLIVI